MSDHRARRPGLLCLIVLCLVCVALMMKAVISFVSFSPWYDPATDEPEVLFDLNASGLRGGDADRALVGRGRAEHGS